MSKIIQISSAKKRRESKPSSSSLTELLKQATTLKREVKQLEKDFVMIDLKGLKQLFETRLQTAVLDRRLISEEAFFCGLYVANLLLMLSVKVPSSWYAVDYFIAGVKKSNPSALQQGADICFSICSVFPARGNWRLMKPAYYRQMGESLYYHYYLASGRPIGYHMSRNFNSMTDLTGECLRSL